MAFVKALRQSTKISRRSLLRLSGPYLRYKRNAGYEESLRLAEVGLDLAQGWNRQEVQALISDNLENVVLPIVFPDGRKAVQLHLAQGHMVVVVSSSPQEIVKPIADCLGIEYVIASIANVDACNCYTGTLDFFAFGQDKVPAMQEFAAEHDANLQNCFAYSDSITDEPMLSAVGHPTAVNPDALLVEHALRNGWQTVEFEL